MLKLMAKVAVLVTLLTALVGSSAPAFAAIHRLEMSLVQNGKLVDGCYCVFLERDKKGSFWQMKPGDGCELDTNSTVPYQCIQTGCDKGSISYCSYEMF